MYAKNNMKTEFKHKYITWLSSAAIAGVISALISASISGYFSWITNKNEVAAKYLETAAAILSSEKKSDDPYVSNQNKALRTWAVRIINKYAGEDSELKIDKELGRALINGDVNFNDFGSTVSPSTASVGIAGATPRVELTQSKSDVPQKTKNDNHNGNVVVNPAEGKMVLKTSHQ